jgi:hypothetical protein
VILIPLVGSLTPGPSGEFITKIARYLSAVTQPDPATGQYNTVDIPTGNDWDLSKMFPGSPAEGVTVVDAGYYVWSASPGVVKATTPEITPNPFPQADIWRYRYRAAGSTNLRYIMLQKPVGVNVFDMQTIRMLPATPSDQALDSFLPTSLSYVTPKVCEAPPAGRESMTNPGTCDPFANVSAATSNSDRTEMLVKIIIGTLTTFGVFLAIYFALKLFTNKEWGFKLPRWGLLAGNWMVNAPMDEGKKVPAPTTFATPDIDTLFGSKAEARLNDTKPSGENPMRKSKAKTDEGTPDIDTLFGPKAEARLGEVTSTSDQPMARAKKAQKDAEAIEQARIEAEAEAAKKAKKEAEAIETARIEAEAEAKKRDDDMAAAIEASRLDAEAEAKRKEEQDKEDAAREAEWQAEDRAKEAKRQAEEEVLRRNGPAGTGLDIPDADLARNAEVEQARIDAEAKLKKDAEATKALFEEAKARKEKEEAEAKEAVEASLRKEKEALEAAEEARIKAEAERVAASASDAASKTLKRRTIKSSERDLANAEAKLAAAEAERKRQVAEYEQKQQEAMLASQPGAQGRASADVPTTKGERPPAAPSKSQGETSLRAVTDAERVKGQINATLASIGKQEVFINANPPTKEHPNRLFNQRLETRLNTSLKTLDSQLSELETLVAKFPADKGLEKMGMTRFIKQTQDKEKKSLAAQNQRFDVLGKIIKEGPAMKAGRRRKRRSTRRYVA